MTLDLRVVHLPRGRSEVRLPEGLQELLYVVSGCGTLVVEGQAHALEPDTAALLLPGQAYELEAETELELVSVTAPAHSEIERERVTLQCSERPEQRADEHRTFRVLFETDVTQFVGNVQPSRAPDHSHPYDEVGYILEGEGFAHIGDESRAIGPGSSFHLLPGQVHCIENSGPGVMRILGVFHPSGSPAQRS
jgi:quercetin dioxygenase-like cupin family protein